jgi:hypothetical protein
MLTWRFVAFACFVIGCRDASDPGFEIVRVPQSAYLAPDAAPKLDAAPVATTTDAGPEPLVLCISRQDTGEESDECPDEHEGRHYDEKATARHRSKGDDSTVCCYRKGRVPRSTRDEE